MVRKRFLIVIVLIIAISLLATVWALSTTRGDAVRDTRGNAVRNLQGTNIIRVPLTLYTVQSVERLINDSLVLPSDTSMLGPSYRALGAGVIGRPHLDEVTGHDGVNRIFNSWVAEVILWNGIFVNGTTTNREILENGGVVIQEASAPAGVNTTRSALDRIAPVELCKNDAQGTTCQTVASSSSGYIVSIRGMAVIVYPEGRAVIWLDDKNLRWYEIASETVEVDKLLALARTMIPQ
ncbi:MAG: hypothetical protein HYU39_10535 [Thaumarchaeota archaeon]|nr:hypothetical protein [Nitrososphaerota archaeon]